MLDKNGTLCVKCMFMTGVTNRSCSVLVKNSNNVTDILSMRAFQEQGTNSASVCINELPAGTYSVCVCSTDCAMDDPTQVMFSYHNLIILGVGKFVEAIIILF